MIPIKELQPTTVDILTEGKKTMVANFGSPDEEESSVKIRLSVEKIGADMTLDHTPSTVNRVRGSYKNDTLLRRKPCCKVCADADL
jgi:hypothetical protein